MGIKGFKRIVIAILKILTIIICVIILAFALLYTLLT